MGAKRSRLLTLAIALGAVVLILTLGQAFLGNRVFETEFGQVALIQLRAESNKLPFLTAYVLKSDGAPLSNTVVKVFTDSGTVSAITDDNGRATISIGEPFVSRISVRDLQVFRAGWQHLNVTDGVVVMVVMKEGDSAASKQNRFISRNK